MEINKLIVENEKLKEDLEDIKEKVIYHSYSTCDPCNTAIISSGHILIHDEKCHDIPPLDGELNSEVESHHKVKVVFISKNLEDAQMELEKYYLNDLPPFNEDTLEYIEEESGDIYEGCDHAYNKGDHRKFVFNIYIDKKYSREEVETKINDDAVDEFSFID